LFAAGSEAGDAEAALLLGATYDPAAVSDFRRHSDLRPDPMSAAPWYQRAMEAGSVGASVGIEQTDAHGAVTAAESRLNK